MFVLHAYRFRETAKRQKIKTTDNKKERESDAWLEREGNCLFLPMWNHRSAERALEFSYGMNALFTGYAVVKVYYVHCAMRTIRTHTYRAEMHAHRFTICTWAFNFISVYIIFLRTVRWFVGVNGFVAFSISFYPLNTTNMEMRTIR